MGEKIIAAFVITFVPKTKKMTSEEARKKMEHYESIVKGKPISKDWPNHLIEGFGIEEPAPGHYELYLVGRAKGGFSSFKKTLSQWLADTGTV